MLCNKCNHKLPDDSAFCQYCGNKLDKAAVVPVKTVVEVPKKAEIPVVVPAATPVAPAAGDACGIDDITPEEMLNAILKAQAKNTISAMEANRQSQPDHENDADFGLVPEKPIYTLASMLVNGEKEYLNKLYTANGEKLTWNRRGSTSVNGVNGMIDIYDTYLPSGQPYKTIYINMYGAKKSEKAPAGFILHAAAVVQTSRKPKKAKEIKAKFCRRCGFVIDQTTKKCTGCGKQYFKRVRFATLISLFVGVLLVCSILLNVFQYASITDLRADNAQLQADNTELQADNAQLQTDNSHLQALYKQLQLQIHNDNKNSTEAANSHQESVLVCNKRSRIYHDGDCFEAIHGALNIKYIEDNDTYIYLTLREALNLGYSKCPECS